MSTEEIIRLVYQENCVKIADLLYGGLNINSSDSSGRTPLMHAILAEHAHPEFVKWLIDRGADVNLHDSGQRWTSLHFAARDQRLDLVRLLIIAGAKVDAADAFGNTPLARCVAFPSVDPVVVTELLRSGANPHCRNLRGSTPIDRAKLAGKTDIVNILEDQEFE